MILSERRRREVRSTWGSLLTTNLRGALRCRAAIFVVKEKEVKAKHQQIISGVSLLAYHLANYIWDLISYLPSLVITLAELYAFKISNYTEGVSARATIVVFVCFAPAVIAQTYMLSYLFRTHSAAQNVILFFNFVTGLILSITSFVLAIIDSTRPTELKLR
jgi:ATP-binding cassette, subfamily A (ABC1), member 3